MEKSVIRLLAIILMIFAGADICPAQDTAMLVGLQNAGVFYESGEKNGQEVMLMDFLKPGDKIRLEPHAMMILNYFEPGLREEITGPGTITVGTGASKEAVSMGNITLRSGTGKESDTINRFKPGLREDVSAKEISTVKIIRTKTHKLPPKVFLLKEDTQQSGAVPLRGGEKEFPIIILGLANTSVRPSVPIIFQWKPVKDAKRYHLRIYDIGNSLHLKTATKETSFTYDKSDLKCNEIYTWRVSASAHEKTYEGNGSFSILSQDSLKKLIQAEEKIKAECPEDSDELLTRLAFIYRYYELNDESAEMLRELHRRHPWNRNIQRWLKKTDPAYTEKAS
jgi:hypothetical protein